MEFLGTLLGTFVTLVIGGIIVLVIMGLAILGVVALYMWAYENETFRYAILGFLLLCFDIALVVAIFQEVF